MTRSLRSLRFALPLLLATSSVHADSKGDMGDAIQATSEGFEAAKNTSKETKEKLDKALETYRNIKEYVSGAKGTELIDRLYQTRGITDHTKVTELRGKLQDVVRALDRAGIEGKLEHASKILDQFDGIAGEAGDALAFMDRFNPEGSRGDPTRGLRTIGAAIEDAAGGLPWPMDEIFKEYAQTTTTFSKKLDELQQSVNTNTRQGSLGGSYASYADAQEFFEKNFEGHDGRTSTTFLDVSYAFPLLGRSVQVFQDVASDRGEYYAFSQDDARGMLVPRSFELAYRYFASLPDQSLIPPSERLSVLIARANSNSLQDQVAEAYRLRSLLEEAYRNKEALLREQGLWDKLGVLLLYGADAFVGFYLLVPEKHAEIIAIRDALAKEEKKKQGGDEEKDDKNEENAQDPTKFAVGLGAPKAELDPGEKITVTATVNNGKTPYEFKWLIDGLPMPGRNEPTLPITFGKLGTHSIGVTVKDSSDPRQEIAGNINLFVGKVNDKDLVGRWSGTATLLEFKQGLEGFHPAVGQTSPIEVRITPDGSGGLVVHTSESPFLCHPDAKVVRAGQHVSVHWDGPSHLPQTEYLTSTVKCSVELDLVDGRLRGVNEATSNAKISIPNNPVQTSSSYVKSSLDVKKVSDSPGPPLATAPRATPPASGGGATP